jgi:hypothetical protein
LPVAASTRPSAARQHLPRILQHLVPAGFAAELLGARARQRRECRAALLDFSQQFFQARTRLRELFEGSGVAAPGGGRLGRQCPGQQREFGQVRAIAAILFMGAARQQQEGRCEQRQQEPAP